MYSILIVDDEKIIREGISKMMPWKELNISKVLMAADGRQALVSAKENRPEIILTDICMPDMDGLHFIHQLIESADQSEDYDYKPRILVLTGHDRFEYAQQSCKLGVKDLLLKPIDEKLLTKVIASQVAEVEKYRDELKKQKHLELQLQRQAQNAHKMKLEQIICDLTDDKNMIADDRKWLMQNEPRLFTGCRMAAFEAENICSVGNEDHTLLCYGIEQFCRQMIDNNNIGVSFYKASECAFLCWFYIDDENHIIDVSNQLCTLIKREFNVKIKAGISKSGKIESSSSVWQEAKAALKKGQAVSSNVFIADDIIRTGLLLKNIYEEKKQQLSKMTDDSQIQVHIVEMTDLLTKMNVDIAIIRKECSEIALFFHWHHINNSTQSPDNSMNVNKESFDNFLRDLTRLDAEIACRRLNNFIQETLLQENGTVIINPIAQQAARYIKDNLSAELSVAGIAEYLHVSPNYLSRIFRQAVGEGCNEYIVRKRIEAAQSLLANTSLKTYEIAEQVGYLDKNYFSLVFRKQTGKTPTEYRKSVQISNDRNNNR